MDDAARLQLVLCEAEGDRDAAGEQVHILYLSLHFLNLKRGESRLG